jgi:hypothetical protein
MLVEDRRHLQQSELRHPVAGIIHVAAEEKIDRRAPAVIRKAARVLPRRGARAAKFSSDGTADL